ncbi:MAG: AAA domain-containing protein, partial [Colwellia sp.]
LLESVLDFKVCEPLTPHELKVIPDLSKIGKGNDGLYNRGAIYLGTPNMYIMGLTKELNNIFNRPESELASTALKNVLYPADDSCQIIDSECKDVYDVGGLNYYQRRAIQIADTAPLTVVTGPPGTGKSQVVIALIVNAILTGKKVLFASRNQQAVNVVEERVNSLVTDIPAMIRVGSAGVDRKADRELIEACSRIINVSNSKKVDRTQLLQESISRQFKVASKLDLELRNIADILSEVNDLDRSYHTMKNDLFPLEEELSVSINKLDFKAVTKYMRKLKFAVTTASGLSLIEPQMFKLLNSMNHQVFDSLMENIKKLEIPIEFSYPSDVASGEQLLKSIAALARFIDTSIKMKEASLKLGEAAEVEELYSKLNSSRSEVLDLTREYVEEFISNKVTSLPDNKLRELHTFTNVFKDIMSDKTGGVRLKKMQHSIKELFTSVMDVFPAWAVTNLSINKRIPLAPGIFDMAIIDEASQCDIASVLPLLYRSKQAVIIGDPLQLQHIVNLDERAMQQLKMKYQLNDTKDSSYSYTTQSI